MESQKKKELLKFAILATDVVAFRIVSNSLCVLLGKVTPSAFFKNHFALVGGLILPEEIADVSAKRHLSQKAGIADIYKEQLYTFSRVDRDPRGRVVSVAYLALAGKDPQNIEKAGVETKWCPVSDLPELAYDHNEIIAYAVKRFRAKIGYTNLAQFLLPEEFTLSELQNVYEVVLGKGLDKRNFRKKIMAAHILKDTKRTRKQGVMRPAALYAYKSKEPAVVEIL